MPDILPQQPFGFDVFGEQLNGYLETGGTRITTNKGTFDTMSRRFIVNTVITNTDAFVPGMADFEFQQMYTERIQVVRNIGGPWSEVEVEYLGVIGALEDKAPLIVTDADTRKTTVSLYFYIGDVLWLMNAVPVEIAEVTVQAVYIQDTLPDFNAAGSAYALSGQNTTGDPPLDIPPPSLESLNAPMGLPPGTIHVYTWFWVLRKRAVRVSGGSGGTDQSLYEVTDSWKRLVWIYGEPISNALQQ